MIASLVGTAAVALAASLIGLLIFGGRWRRPRLFVGGAYAALVVVAAYVVGEIVWKLPPDSLWLGCVLVSSAFLVASVLKRDWNAPAQAFLATSALTCFVFVLFAADFVLSEDLPLLAYPASLVLIALEIFTFALLLISAHEVLDVVGRVRWRRRTQGIDRGSWAPFVSIHVPTHNEPPELVLETLGSLRELDYPAYEVLVLDNNTADEALWRPVERYCEQAGFRFVHLANWAGFKAGALNHGLRILDDRTEIVAVVDADFVVDPEFLSLTVGYFAEPNVAIVQTQQSFRAEDESGYLRSLALSYRAFDEVTMPSRNERNAIIFAGTMGLIRRSALVEAGGWGEWCVTEDAELSLRILARGSEAVYVERTFGRGVMPLTFAALKRQRFRWCFGGIQILRRHWRLLIFGRGVAPDGRELGLTLGQRYDYLTGGLQWFQALVAVVFSVFLLLGVASRMLGEGIALRPLVGFFVAVPSLLLLSGVVKALWGLRARLRADWGDAIAVAGVWLSLTWAVALGCIQGLTRREGAFLRTPKFRQYDSLRQALEATRIETLLALALTAGAASAAASGTGVGSIFLAALCAWSALVFVSAPVTAFIASRTELRSVALRKRRRLEATSGAAFIARRPTRYAVAAVAASALFALTATSLSVVPERSIGEAFALPHHGDAGNGGSDAVGSPTTPRPTTRRLTRLTSTWTSVGASSAPARERTAGWSGSGTSRPPRPTSRQPVDGPGSVPSAPQPPTSAPSEPQPPTSGPTAPQPPASAPASPQAPEKPTATPAAREPERGAATPATPTEPAGSSTSTPTPAQPPQKPVETAPSPPAATQPVEPPTSTPSPSPPVETPASTPTPPSIPPPPRP